MRAAVPVAILGGGPAGWTAAIYAARALLDPLVITGPQPGGQLTITTDVENYPGFAQVIQGPWLMEQMEQQARGVGARVLNETVVSVDLSHPPFRLEGDSGSVITAETLIIATGAKAKWLGLDSEEKYKGFGVSACATCDGFFYRDKDVLVVGGGNTAAEEALFLTRFARTVTLIHRRETLRAEKLLQQRLFKNEKISILWNTVLEAVEGEDSPPSVKGVRVKDLTTGKTTRLSVEGVFIAIGHEPATHLFRSQLRMKDNGIILTAPESTAASVPGVFAAGDVADDVYRQAVTAAGMGSMAALEAATFLSKKD